MEFPKFSNPLEYDFSKLDNFVYPEKSLIKETDTIVTAESRCYSLREGYIMAEGLYKGDIEIKYSRLSDKYDSFSLATIHDICLFSFNQKYDFQRERAAELLAEAKSLSIELPKIWFYVSSKIPFTL